MYPPLGDALAVEVLQLFDQVYVLQQRRPAAAGCERVLVIGDGDARGGGECGVRHRVSLWCLCDGMGSVG
jgi:hypothetical protein